MHHTRRRCSADGGVHALGGQTCRTIRRAARPGSVRRAISIAGRVHRNGPATTASAAGCCLHGDRGRRGFGRVSHAGCDHGIGCGAGWGCVQAGRTDATDSRRPRNTGVAAAVDGCTELDQTLCLNHCSSRHKTDAHWDGRCLHGDRSRRGFGRISHAGCDHGVGGGAGWRRIQTGRTDASSSRGPSHRGVAAAVDGGTELDQAPGLNRGGSRRETDAHCDRRRRRIHHDRG